ncbi:terminase family protein [Sphingomonas bacterium]|uniref:terminase large subunit domain-containing protein n=1 Tax=Sphingomonas bacterium TaxID=1895847 RepID=UPI002608B5EB|nr:terminase family protein [Sphingomonas bacterium]MDB5679127.1 ATP-binding protein [Sphingomonas bacterium]
MKRASNRPRRLPRDTDIIEFLRALPPHWRRQAVAMLGTAERDALDRDWPGWAHEGQAAPASLPDGGDWSTWVLMAGRGFGKTLAGAQWIAGEIAAGKVSIALVGATLDDARRVMVEGRSGLLTVAADLIRDWHPSLRRLTFTSGAEATLFSGASPDMLRGPEHHVAWCDELAKWDKPQECWDMLQLGLRLGHPRALITTTPKPGPVLRGIMADPATVTTGGPTRRNPHLPKAYKARVERLYGGTRLGEQEIEGRLLTDAAGALWTVELIERCRLSLTPSREREGAGGGLALTTNGSDADSGCPPPDPLPQAGGGAEFARTLIAVDPPAIDGTCGIVAVARSGEGQHAVAHILADHSVTGRSPDGWARAVAAAAAAHDTDEVIAEANQGGKMVKQILLAADPRLRVRLVRASKGKVERAEPVAHLFEAGRAVLHGRMPALEAEMKGMIAGGGYDGPGKSPDRADAMVWGVGEVMRGGEVRVIPASQGLSASSPIALISLKALASMSNMFRSKETIITAKPLVTRPGQIGARLQTTAILWCHWT